MVNDAILCVQIVDLGKVAELRRDGASELISLEIPAKEVRERR